MRVDSNTIIGNETVPVQGKKTNIRWFIVSFLFIVTTINYADRATISVAATPLQSDLGISAVTMGFIFSAFSWSYALGQIPGGWLLDRFGTKRVLFWSLFLWSFFTLLQGFVGLFSASTAIILLFVLRFIVGLAEAPSFPGNSQVAASWFPDHERGTASAIFSASAFLAIIVFTPFMSWITAYMGWEHVFTIMGALGIVISFIWLKVIHNPKDHPRVNQAELDYIEDGGGLLDMMGENANKGSAQKSGIKWSYIKQIMKSRMLVGVYIGQYCISTLTYFFMTWFPVYLIQERGMSILQAGFVAVLPGLSGFIGGILGGIYSDYLLKKGKSLTFARKTPIIIGMILSSGMIACNYTNVEWHVVGIMALAFFGKGFGQLGWAVMADSSPKEIGGLSGGLFNTFGNISGITTPIIIGFIISATGSFHGALVFVGINAIVAMLSYLLIVGDIKRLELHDDSSVVKE
ncbi:MULTISPECIES: MFS transporter [Bacillus]|uniref:MFS transporter n=1 Tax=Bacillus xiamenensis TaxID=1178537 RepID=A0ABT4F0X6_9BACI|nr:MULTISPECIES: MFS transporter [Bacillus]EKF34060.1 glucarate transporter [Bacillus xiamenensis]MBG9910105.1 glucarate transporter [Bacillus xiamenensis]MCW1837222.1 MFS transporter [Bacillus xiamenensis]MCY9575707.1 MFS transporter [Bacillus xiamenensis]QGX67315.1 MFS transporter [Bacillus sp. ms-22]